MGSSTIAVLGLLSTAILTLLGVAGFFRSFIRSARTQREKIASDKLAEYNRGLSDRQTVYNDGQADARRELEARNGLLEARFEDAKRDRDLQQERADRMEERADRLEAELRRMWSGSRARPDPDGEQGD